MAITTVLLAGLVATAVARPGSAPSGPAPPQVDGESPVAPGGRTSRTGPSYGASGREVPSGYDFAYTVKDDYSGNDFGHQETRNGYDTKGSYYVPLPDGRLQKVTYYVNGDSGFVAEVTYEGEATYPPYNPAPAYKPATEYA